jgi:hypothetical protein
MHLPTGFAAMCLSGPFAGSFDHQKSDAAHIPGDSPKSDGSQHPFAGLGKITATIQLKGAMR